MTEFTIRLLDDGGIQIPQTELAKLQAWQEKTKSQVIIQHIGPEPEPWNLREYINIEQNELW